MGSLDGRSGIVTGAGSGIGAAVAHELGARGATVGVLDVNLDAAEAVAASIQDAGGAATAHRVDVSRFESLEEVVAAIGRVDYAVACAGLADFSSMHDGDVEHWRRVVDVNLLGIAYTVRAVLPAMKAATSGDIVLMASIASRASWVGEPIYIATKWGVAGLGQALRREANEYGVRVTLIEPGIVDTPMVRATQTGRAELDRYPSLTPNDVAQAVAWSFERPANLQVSELEIRPVGPDVT